MNTISSTEVLIEDLLAATYGCGADTRQKFVFREALRSLVRLAKAEQVLEMRTTVEKLIGHRSSSMPRQRGRSKQKLTGQSGRWPQQMEFNQFD
jgi:hypothetical protein